MKKNIKKQTNILDVIYKKIFDLPTKRIEFQPNLLIVILEL